MVLTLGPDLAAALKDLAVRKGVAPDELALDALRATFLKSPALQPRDDWERQLLGLAKDCGITLPHWALGSEGLYE